MFHHSDQLDMMWHILYLLVLVLLNGQSNGSRLGCEEKEKSLAALDLAKDALSKAKDLYPNCSGDINYDKNATLNNSTCGKREKSIGYIEVAMDLISEARKRYPTCPLPKLEKLRDDPVDCSDVLENGQNTSGIYTIWPKSRISGPLVVFCDMETDGGGWTVIQRRGRFSKQEDFYRDWNDYKIGFGNITREFWIGNDNIFFLSNQGLSSIRFDMKDAEGNSAFALYEEFWIEDENSNYTLHVSNYSGNAGDCMTYHNNMTFSTKDRRNDKNSTPCAVERQSGWWFNKCDWCNPNGLYMPGLKEEFKGYYWYHWKKAIGLATMEIKLRRV